MGGFKEPLDLRYIDGHEWLLTHSFTYWTWVVREGRKLSASINVPAGFTTDFASIPRAFWWLLPPTGKYGKAAVIHDYIYRTPEAAFTRAEADGIFRDAMQDLGVSAVTRTVMYRTVRLFGGSVFKARS